MNEVIFFAWFPLIAICVYCVIRLFYKLEWEWIPFVYIAVCCVAVIVYHWNTGSWETIIAGWIDAVSWPTDTTGVEFKRNWFGEILEYVYLGLLVLVIWATYLVDKHDKLLIPYNSNQFTSVQFLNANILELLIIQLTHIRN